MRGGRRAGQRCPGGRIAGTETAVFLFDTLIRLNFYSLKVRGRGSDGADEVATSDAGSTHSGGGGGSGGGRSNGGGGGGGASKYDHSSLGSGGGQGETDALMGERQIRQMRQQQNAGERSCVTKSRNSQVWKTFSLCNMRKGDRYLLFFFLPRPPFTSTFSLAKTKGAKVFSPIVVSSTSVQEKSISSPLFPAGATTREKGVRRKRG